MSIPLTTLVPSSLIISRTGSQRSSMLLWVGGSRAVMASGEKLSSSSAIFMKHKVCSASSVGILWKSGVSVDIAHVHVSSEWA